MILDCAISATKQKNIDEKKSLIKKNDKIFFYVHIKTVHIIYMYNLTLIFNTTNLIIHIMYLQIFYFVHFISKYIFLCFFLNDFFKLKTTDLLLF